jgi:tetratricopeptide (TPR) repeat protein
MTEPKEIQLTLPGVRTEAASGDAGLGEFAKLLDTEVVAATDVRTIRRGQAPPPQRVSAHPDDVLELRWEDEIVELIRVGDLEDHFPQSVRSADGRLEIPTRRTLRTATRGPREINLEAIQQIRLKVVEKIAGKAVDFAIPPALKLLEKRLIPEPGLYPVKRTGKLGKLGRPLPDASRPFLVLLHGTFSSTQGSFSKLFESEDWARLVDAYDNRILALEQHTVTESPAGNALQLVAGLPKGARLHLLSHSRGGLIGDLLCRQPWKDTDVEELFGDPTYKETAKQLRTLLTNLNDQQLVVERFARVASPAAGTLLASKRLDTYLNVILTILGKISGPAEPAVAFMKAIATTIISARTRADALPGIEAMMPHTDRGFVPFLNLAKPHGHELAVIAGDVHGGGLFDRVKDFFSHLYYREDNDFVVDSRSMFRGAPREEARGFYYRSPRANHFSYFEEADTRERMVEWLVDGRDDRFYPLNAARPYGGLRSYGELRGDTKLGKAAETRGIPTLDEIEKDRRERPVVFLLPGIMGTHLALDRKRQWIHVRRLALGGLHQLEIKAENIEPDGLVETVYERLFDHLRLEYDVIPFGFDWRLPIAGSAKLLGTKIKSELDAHNRPVRIVAHSMGGLVSRALILECPDLWQRMTRRGGRLLMLGTPNHGSYVPAQVMTREHRLMKYVAAADLHHSLDDLTLVVRAFPGLVEMLPLKDGTDLLDPEKWKGFGDFAPNAGALDAARAFRLKLANAAIDPEAMIYVAGRADATPAAMERAGSDVTFRYTGRGDGTVPWDLGLLDGVDTYYVDAEHGQIPNHPPAFDAFMELLANGRTSKLKTMPPVVRRGAGDELFDLEPDDAEEVLRYYPDEADLIAELAGRPRERELGPPLELEVTCIDVREAKHPVLVGHYIGDPIVSVERILDGALQGCLSRDLRLGRYPGAIGDARYYPGATKPPGVLVTGLGEVGRLRRLGLEEALGAALMEYAVQNLAEEGKPCAELRVSSLLIGTFGGTRLTVEDSVAALSAAALSTNQLLDEQDLAGRVSIRGIEIVELYRDIATEAGHAAQRIAARSDGLVSAAQIVKQGKGMRRSRPASPYGSGWSRRIRVRTKHGQAINYEVTTDLARSEPMSRDIQWSHVDSLLTNARKNDPEAASTLFQYLLPHQLIAEAANMPDVVLQLDVGAAHIPWELLDRPRSEGDTEEPLGVRVGFLRTLSTLDRRVNPRRARGRRALVIGEPAGVVPALPGAKQEAVEVAKLLQGRAMNVEELVGADADEIFRALYRHEYDIIHIAAHGAFKETKSDTDSTAGAEAKNGSASEAHGSEADGAETVSEKPRSGVVIGDDRYLGPVEFANLQAVPSIVFLNCCHLGKLGDGSRKLRVQQPGRLAASVAKELIEMGVGVVVVAGWAVADEAAKVFAEALYSELLDGATLIDAVRVARPRAYTAGRSADTTWGAYQVYGDPGYVLHWAERRGRGREPQDWTFVSPHEFEEYVSDFTSRGRGVSKKEAAKLKESLKRLEYGLPREWSGLGRIQAALGDAYSDLGLYPEAIKRYERAIAKSDAPFKAIEQLASTEKRAADAIAKKDPTQALERLDDSIKRLEHLCEVSESSERRSLMGASFKLQARLASPKSQDRTEYLAKARKEYENACALKPPNLYYPLSNRLALDLSLDPKRVTKEDLDNVIRSAKECADEWSPAALADAGLLGFLAFGEGTAKEVASAYLAAFVEGAGATQRERDSMLQQLKGLTEFLTQTHKARATKVRSLLLSMVDELS